MNIFRGREVYHFDASEIVKHSFTETIVQIEKRDVPLISGEAPTGRPKNLIQSRSWRVIDDRDNEYSFYLSLDLKDNVHLQCTATGAKSGESYYLINNELILTDVVRMSGDAFMVQGGDLYFLNIHSYSEDGIYFTIDKLPLLSDGRMIIDFATSVSNEDETPFIFIVLDNGHLYMATPTGLLDNPNVISPSLHATMIAKDSGFDIFETTLHNVSKIKVFENELATLEKNDHLTIHLSTEITIFGVIDIETETDRSQLICVDKSGIVGIFFRHVYWMRWMDEWGTGFSLHPVGPVVKSARF